MPCLLLYDPIPVFPWGWLFSGYPEDRPVLLTLVQVLCGGLLEGLAGHANCAKGNDGADHSAITIPMLLRLCPRLVIHSGVSFLSAFILDSPFLAGMPASSYFLAQAYVARWSGFPHYASCFVINGGNAEGPRASIACHDHAPRAFGT